MELYFYYAGKEYIDYAVIERETFYPYFYTGKGVVEVATMRGSESVQMRFYFRRIHYERGRPAVRGDSQNGCCPTTSLPYSCSLSRGFCGIIAHSVMQIIEVTLKQQQTGSEIPCR